MHLNYHVDLNHLLLLLKTELVQMKQKCFIILVALIVSLQMFSMLIITRRDTAEKIKHVSTPTQFLENEEAQSISFLYEKTIHTAPETSFTRKMTQGVIQKINVSGYDPPLFTFYKSEKEVIHRFDEITTNQSHPPTNFIGIIFEDEAANPDIEVPDTLSYKLRFGPTVKFHPELLFPALLFPGPDLQDPYLTSGFTALQLMLDKTFIEILKAKELEGTPLTDLKDEILTQKMPYPPYVEDNEYLETIHSFWIPAVASLSFASFTIIFVLDVMVEKKSGVRELMRLKGIKDWVLFASKFIHGMFIHLVSVFFVVLILNISFLSTGAILPKTSCSLLFIMLLLYGVATLILAFAITSIFSAPIIAIIVINVIWLSSVHIPVYFLQSNPSFWFYGKISILLMPNMGLYYIFNIILDFENRGIGGQWLNIFESGSGVAEDITMFYMIIMFMVSSIIFGAITWYFTKINPGRYGIALPWNFPFKKEYWFPSKANVNQNENVSEDPPNFEHPLMSETNDNIAVKIRGLTKTYHTGLCGKKEVQAIQGVSLDLYKGKVTVLMGQNGAGKTTIISILTGMTTASGGKISILGHDLATDLSGSRSSLGFCPQHNLFLGDLSVIQNLIFFARLKGKSYEDAKVEADNLADTVELRNYKSRMAFLLSGGNQRKLSLAIALVGDPEVLILDEPTAGLDPEARTRIWREIKSRGCAILLSTHLVEEAEVLGDAIVIMDHGRVRCCGSSLYLKRKFSTGYHLTLMRSPDCNIDTLTEAVCNVVPDAVLGDQEDLVVPHTGPLTFRLPINHSDKFTSLLDKLESEREILGISKFSISAATMEDVFQKVGERTHSAPNHQENGLNNRNEEMEALHFKKNVGTPLYIQQMQALVWKKLLFTAKKWRVFLFNLAFLFVLMMVTIYLSNAIISVNSKHEPARELSLSAYGTSSQLQVLYSVSGGAEAKAVAQSYQGVVKEMAAVKNKTSVEETLLKIASKSLHKFHTSYIAAGIVNESIVEGSPRLRVTALYSNKAFHANPISLNLMTNALLRYHTSGEHNIKVTNHPLSSVSPYTYVPHQQVNYLTVGYIWFLLASSAWFFPVASNIILPLQERTSGSRQLQVLAGCSKLMVWLSYFLVDIVINTVLALLVIIIICIVDSTGTFSGSTELGTLFLLFFMYGLTATLFTYVNSLTIETVPVGYTYLIMMNIFHGFLVNIAVIGLENKIVEDVSLQSTASSWRIVSSLVLPHSALISALFHFGATAAYNAQCQHIPESAKKFLCTELADGLGLKSCCENVCTEEGSCHKNIPYLAWSGAEKGSVVEQFGPIGRDVFVLAMGSLLWLVLIVLCESDMVAQFKEYVYRSLQHKYHPQENTDVEITQDEDVAREAKRVQECNRGNSVERPVLVVEDLAKDFGLPACCWHRFPAVTGISFAVKPGECFGLLGENGAGKTTVFRMLTGAVVPTRGNTSALGAKLLGDRDHYLKNLGYCSQFDKQIGVLNANEALTLYANLRGLPKEKIPGEIEKWLDIFGLLDCASQATSTYSAGNLRKLSTAIALIGDPPVVLLDEPTRGVDPIVRQQLWQVLKQCKHAEQAIVLTSHSMEECETLCDLVGIMVRGQLKCLGSISHLKCKFGVIGFTIKLQLRCASSRGQIQDNVVEELKRDVKESLDPCELRDEYQGLLSCHVINRTKRWRYLFSVMEQLKEKYPNLIENYYISERVLEQVFLSVKRPVSSCGQTTASSSSVSPTTATTSV